LIVRVEVVVQHVQTSWTKLSRGGPAAAVRNRVPVAYSLPEGLRAPGVQRVTHRESDGFIPQKEERDFKIESQGTRLRYAELALVDDDGERLRVALHPSAHGMPRRHRRPPSVRLLPGEWLRWQVNYRFVGVSSGEWHYRLDTFNVGFGAVHAELFLCEPTRQIDERTHLR
jgi:hypothetical protein